MTAKKYNVTPDGLTDEKAIEEKRRGNPEERNKCPGAFLLTVEEARALYTIRDIKIEVFAKYNNIQGETSPEELENLKIEDIIKELKRIKMPLKPLRKTLEKAQSALTWTATPFYRMFAHRKPFEEFHEITTSNPEQIPKRIISAETCPAFYAASNRAEKAKALDIPELYLYVSPIEQLMLNDLFVIFERIDMQKHVKKATKAPETSKSIVTTYNDDKFLTIVSSPLTNAYSSIGTNAKKPTINKSRDEKGRQIDIAEYLTNLGIKVTFKDFTPYKNNGFVTVGDPNTDKLLTQAQIVAIQEGRKEIEIPISEFMEFRQIPTSCRKDAIEKAEKACDILVSTGLNVDERSEYASIHGGFRYVQKAFVMTCKGRGGNKICIQLSDDLFSHLTEMHQSGQQIEKLDKIIMQIPDNQNTAYNIAREFSRHLRINAGRKTAHKLAVKTLLSYCPILPLYPESAADAGKENYLRFQSEAPDRIIKPFVKALKFLTENPKCKVFSDYAFVDKNDKPITAAQLEKMQSNYEQFITLFVKVNFTNEPDYKNLIEQKTKRAEQKKKPKKNT